MRIQLLIVSIILALFIVLKSDTLTGVQPTNEETTAYIDPNKQLYQEIGLENVVNYELFDRAVKGYNKITDKHSHLITVIDFTKPSTEERLYVIDLENKKLLFKTYVSHGRNSGGNFAESFSNKPGSNKSSLGFFLTDKTYIGKNGYSLLLNGLEEGINDNARTRAIVIHAAAYANPSVIAGSGRLGRSLGCPALPTAVSKDIINTIKDGSLLYIHGNDPDYKTKSKIA